MWEEVVGSPKAEALDTVAAPSDIRLKKWLSEAHYAAVVCPREQMPFLWLTRATWLIGVTLLASAVAQGSSPLMLQVSFLAAAWIALCFYVWPTNRAALRVAKAQNGIESILQELESRLWEVRADLWSIQQDPINGSPVAYIGNALKQIELADLSEEETGLDAFDLEQLAARNIFRLSEVPADLPDALRESAPAPLFRLRQKRIERAQKAFGKIQETRRRLQREFEALQAQREGLMEAQDEVKHIAEGIGSSRLSRFLGRIIGLSS